MGWYTVVKTINRRRYLYLQTTYRQGGKVKTKNKYIGPVGTAFSWEPRPAARISQDLQHATVERDILRDHVASHPARRFLKYRGRTDRQSVGGTSFAELNAQALKTGAKGKYLDTMLSESGFADFDALDESVEEYFHTKQQLADVQQQLNELRTENSYATKYHRSLGSRGDQESVIREIKDPPAPRPKPPPKVRPPKPPKPAGGLKVDPIVRFNDLSKDEQKSYLRNSKRRIAEDARREQLEHELSKLPEEDRANEPGRLKEERRIARERREEAKAKKREPEKGSRWMFWRK